MKTAAFELCFEERRLFSPKEVKGRGKPDGDMHEERQRRAIHIVYEENVL